MVPAIELGEYDHALDLLDLQCKQRSGFMIPFLKVDPVYDPLRGLPRFAELLRCAKLAAPAHKNFDGRDEHEASPL